MCKKIQFFILVIFFLIKCNKFVYCDDFPSLLSANASIAIILDREYLNTAYEELLKQIKVIVEKLLREDLRNGGLIVTYYSWTSINLKRDFTGVFSVTNCRETWSLFKACRDDSLLLMALTDPDCPRLPQKEAIMIPILTSGEELPQVILDMKSSNALNWKSAIVLHDDTFGRDMISRVIVALSTESLDGSMRPMSLSVFKIKAHIHEWERRKSIRKVLSGLPTKFIGKNFIAVVTTDLMENIMDLSKDLGMVDTFSKWLYVVSDTNEINNNISSIEKIIGEGDNVAFVYNLTRDGKECTNGILCHSEELLKTFVLALSRMIREEKTLYGQTSDEEWETIRPTKHEKRDKILNNMQHYLTEYSLCANCTTWRIQAGETWGKQYSTSSARQSTVTFGDDFWDTNKEIVHFQSHNSTLLQVGFWKSAVGILQTDHLYPHVENGFRQKNLHIVTYHNPPWQIISFNESGYPSTTRGVVIDILNELSKKLNFTYTLHISTTNLIKGNDSEELYLLGNASQAMHVPTIYIPSEILHFVRNDKVIFAAAGLTVNERYQKIINFTIPISIQPYSFLVARPRELSRLYLFMLPFTKETWLCLGFTLFFMGPFLFLVNKLSPFYDYYGIRKKGGIHNLEQCFWYMYGALLQQGGMYLPKADSGRLIVGTWWLVVLVFVTTYCGNLVAFLTFPKIDIPITTVNQLINNKHGISWGIKSGTFLEEYLKETDEKKYLRLLEGATFHNEESIDIIDKVRLASYVYIDWKTNLQYIMKREFLQNDRCDFALGAEDFLDEQIGLIFPKNSPYLNLINEEIKKLHQMGLIQRWLKEYLPKKDRCWNIGKLVEVNNHTVNVDDMQGSFLVLLVGFLFSTFVILVEYCYNRRSKTKENLIIKPYVD